LVGTAGQHYFYRAFMSIEISQESAQFIDAAVASGAFPNSTEVIDRAISLLRQRQEAIDRILAHPVPLPELPRLLERQPDGYVNIRGHRLGLHLLLQQHFAGDSAAQIQDRFSSLSLAEVEEVLAFVQQHPDAMRAYLDQQQTIQRLMLDEAGRGPTVEELRTRWQAKFGTPFVSACP
jgi:Arc/MetJ-type ribon-helix-helix transcriptional regulator